MVAFRRPAALALSGLCCGCSGVQSALAPAGAESGSILVLFLVMALGGGVIWLSVAGTLLHAIRPSRPAWSDRCAGRLIFWGGAVFPSVTLVLLLGFALWLIPGIRPWAMAGGVERLRIEVTGEQFWWRVAYFPPGAAEPIISANEVRLPVGEPVDVVLRSRDVIHSFWLPPLAGKMDLIPGRTNRLSLHATKAGTFRGPCAEFCGPSHALMALAAVTMEQGEFFRWLAAEATASSRAAARGLELFLRNGCGACHAIRGTEARGTIGPDLSHVGSRKTIGAAILPNTEEAIARFIAHPDRLKPGVAMPAFDMLPEAEVSMIAAYLKGLE